MRRIHEAPDYWVPENFMYVDSEDCMDEHPECPAVGLFDEGWQTKYDKAIAALRIMSKGAGNPECLSIEQKVIDESFTMKCKDILKELGELN